MPGKKRLLGFTLVEVLVAIMIFGFIGVAAHRMLNSAFITKDIQEQRSKRIAELQRAMLILNRDFLQVANRPIRDEYGDPFPLMKLESDPDGTDSQIEFTRHGWRNPLGFPRSSLQHIRYEFDDEKLIRRYWLVLDRMSDSKSYKQVLLEKVDGVVFEVQGTPLSGSTAPSWQRKWPRSSDDSELYNMPVGIKITLKTQDLGDIERVFALGNMASGANDRGSRGGRN